MEIWKILGIEPTKEEEEIRDAYRRQLPLHHPEEDPEGFQQLREAYQKALDSLKEEEAPKEENEITRWIDKVKEVYEDFAKRIDISCWKKLLEDDVCIGLDSAKEASEQLLVYFMDHFCISHEVLALLAEHFCWFENKQELFTKFPENYMEFILSNAAYEDRIRHSLFQVEPGKDYTAFINTYLDFHVAIERNDMEKIPELLKTLLDMEIDHPDFTILRVRYALIQEDYDTAMELAVNLLETGPRDRQTYYCVARVYLAEEKPDEAREYFDKIYQENDQDMGAIVGIGECLFAQKKYSEALEYMTKAQKIDEYNSYVYSMLVSIHGALLEQYKQELSEKGENEELLWKAANSAYESRQYKAAITYLEKISPKKEEEEEYYRILGDSNEELEQYNESIEAFKSRLEYAKEKAPAYADLGLAYKMKGDFTEALKCYDAGFLEDPKLVALYYRKAAILNKQEKYNETLELCDKGLKLDPEMPNLYYHKGEAYYRMGDFQEAVENCDQALERVFYGEAYLIKGKIFYATEQYEEAINLVENLRKNEYEPSELLLLQVRTLRKLERYEEEEEILKEVLLKEDLEQKDLFYREYSLLFCDRADYPNALIQIQKAIQTAPEEDNYCYTEAYIFKRLKKYDQAIEIFKRFIQEDKADDFDYCRLADVYKDKGEYENSVKAYEKAIEINPTNNYAHSEVADVYELMENFEAAIQHMDEQLKIAEGEYYFLQRGFFHGKLRHQEQAIKDYNEVLRLNPENGYANNNLGCEYRDMGDLETAVPYFEKAYELNDKENKHWYLNLGRAYGRLGKTKEAFEVYKKGSLVFPDDPKFYDFMADMCLELEQWEEAAKYYKKYGEMSGNKAYMYRQLADAYEDIKDKKEILEYFKLAIKADKKSMRNYSHMASYYQYKLKDYKNAVKYYKKALALDGEDIDILCRLSRNCQKIGKETKSYLKKAVELALKNIEKDDRCPCYYEQAGEAYLLLKNYEKAIEYLKKSIELGKLHTTCPTYGCYEGIYYLGEAMEETGELQAALQYYQQAYDLFDCDHYKEAIERVKQILSK